ncbi:ABC transporter ATP-binding protein [Microbacterium sp. NIBRBAC000506063]|uniref:ABC transporter ATP-binding protein n=1 Tax=Microbacterium sp. NIBRBAC000506063 TaxID=2734618 RepID=UPI001BB6898D|nr:ABC transporter ATP-binding protein [Microbacterium sp. NIBRBAC000506063]QTV79067.1 ABC transporter ATP-binding protein [Microbacterium sp. NIBRBAC000506063]
MMSDVLLELSGVQTGYGDLKVVRDVSLTVRAGEITVLLGRNGAGKTTTLRAITGLNRLFGGSISYLGEPLSSDAPHKRVAKGISYVQEGKKIFRELTIEQNLLLGGFSQKKGKRALAASVEEIYQLFPILGSKRALHAASMSGGQQQMLAIGQALMAKPTLLILDEPSQGLAPVVVKEVMERVHDLKDTGIGILLVEQAVQDSVAIADEVSVVEMGKTVLAGPASKITAEDLQKAYFGAG